MTDASQEAVGDAYATTKHVDGHVCCVSCAYNLCGLSEDGNCPECGTTVLRTLQKDALHFSCPRWLHLVLQGVSLAAFGLFGFIILTASTLVLLFLAIAVDSYWTNYLLLPMQIMALLSLFVLLLGCWMACAKEPRTETHLHEDVTRQLIKYLPASIVATLLISSYLFSRQVQTSGQSTRLIEILENLVWLVLFEMCVGLAMAASIFINRLLSRSQKPLTLIKKRFQVWALVSGILFAIKTAADLMQQITGTAQYLSKQTAFRSLIETVLTFGSAYLTITLTGKLFELRSAIRDSLTAARIIN